MLNFYRPCIPKAAAIQAPLNLYLHGTKKKDRSPLEWHVESDNAFEECKASLVNAALLAHPKFDADLTVYSDASNNCMGAVLQQKEGNHWVPLGFFSKVLSEAQKKYSTYDRELLAIYSAIRHFRPVLEGRKFVIKTDHKPLIYSMFQKPSSASPIRIRWLNFISQFSTDIQHVGGEKNPVADALSRVEELYLTGDISRLGRLQKEDPEAKELCKQSNLKLKWFNTTGSDIPILYETTTAQARVYLPKSMRKEVFDHIHGLSHPGVRATRKLISQKYFWPKINSDVAEWARCCIPCQLSKVTRHTVTPPGRFEDAGRFDHIHIDIIGPLPPSQGKRYCLSIIDRFTRWPEAIPIEEITADIVATAFYEGWICRFGVPSKLTTDQGRQFESSLFVSLTNFLGIQKIHTTPYHPQGNGCVERWHRTLKAALMSHLDTREWTKILSTVLLGLRVTIRDDTNYSVAEAVYGQTLRLPGEFLSPSTVNTNIAGVVQQLKDFVSKLRPATFRTSGRSIFVHKELAETTHMFLREDKSKKSLTPPYSGPYRVLSRTDKCCTLQLPNRELTVSLDRVKPAFLLAAPDYEPSIPRTTPIREEKKDTVDDRRIQLPAPTVKTRSGRTVRPNVRFMDAVIKEGAL